MALDEELANETLIPPETTAQNRLQRSFQASIAKAVNEQLERGFSVKGRNVKGVYVRLERLRAVVFPEAGSWVAQCLEVDVAAFGKDADAASTNLKDSLTAHVLLEGDASLEKLRSAQLPTISN